MHCTSSEGRSPVDELNAYTLVKVNMLVLVYYANHTNHELDLLGLDLLGVHHECFNL